MLFKVYRTSLGESYFEFNMYLLIFLEYVFFLCTRHYAKTYFYEANSKNHLKPIMIIKWEIEESAKCERKDKEELWVREMIY